MMKIFRGRYDVEDGYAGRSRPQDFQINSFDIESDMDGADLENLFDEIMQEEFKQTITPYALNKDEFVKWAEEIQEKE